jgi:hypothetical protein
MAFKSENGNPSGVPVAGMALAHSVLFGLVKQQRLSLVDAAGRAHQRALPTPTTKTMGDTTLVPAVPALDDVTLIGIAKEVGSERMLAATIAAEG